MIICGNGPYELIIWLLHVLKNDIIEVQEVMFQGVEKPCKLIFCILSNEICELDVF
jgi:hypothetical protein